MNDTNKVASTAIVKDSTPHIPPTPVITERKKQATTEKQLAALKAGQEKRWKLMFEALEKEKTNYS